MNVISIVNISSVSSPFQVILFSEPRSYISWIRSFQSNSVLVDWEATSNHFKTPLCCCIYNHCTLFFQCSSLAGGYSPGFHFPTDNLLVDIVLWSLEAPVSLFYVLCLPHTVFCGWLTVGSTAVFSECFHLVLHSPWLSLYSWLFSTSLAVTVHIFKSCLRLTCISHWIFHGNIWWKQREELIAWIAVSLLILVSGTTFLGRHYNKWSNREVGTYYAQDVDKADTLSQTH